MAITEMKLEHDDTVHQVTSRGNFLSITTDPKSLSSAIFYDQLRYGLPGQVKKPLQSSLNYQVATIQRHSKTLTMSDTTRSTLKSLKQTLTLQYKLLQPWKWLQELSRNRRHKILKKYRNVRQKNNFLHRQTTVGNRAFRQFAKMSDRSEFHYFRPCVYTSKLKF